MIEDSSFKMDSIMHNPKTGRGGQHTKQVTINEDTLAYLAPQQQSIFILTVRSSTSATGSVIKKPSYKPYT